MEKRITFGLHKVTEKMVSIEGVESGLACNCKCPNCGADLIARKGEVNIHHFAHFSGVECAGAYESALHKLAKQILAEERQIHLPDGWHSNGKPKEGRVIKFIEVKLEKNEDERRPDAIGSFLDIDNNKKTLWIEFANTHFVNEEKKNRIKESEISCIEIDIREQSEKSLKSFLIGNGHKREWINDTLGENEKLILGISPRGSGEQRNSEIQRTTNTQSEEQIRKRLEKAKIEKENYLKKNKEFEEEGRKVMSSFSPIYIKPYDCPRKNERSVGCRNCEYKISLFQNHKEYSDVVCAYWAKRKQPQN